MSVEADVSGANRANLIEISANDMGLSSSFFSARGSIASTNTSHLIYITGMVATITSSTLSASGTVIAYEGSCLSLEFNLPPPSIADPWLRENTLSTDCDITSSLDGSIELVYFEVPAFGGPFSLDSMAFSSEGTLDTLGTATGMRVKVPNGGDSFNWKGGIQVDGNVTGGESAYGIGITGGSFGITFQSMTMEVEGVVSAYGDEAMGIGFMSTGDIAFTSSYLTTSADVTASTGSAFGLSLNLDKPSIDGLTGSVSGRIKAEKSVVAGLELRGKGLSGSINDASFSVSGDVIGKYSYGAWTRLDVTSVENLHVKIKGTVEGDSQAIGISLAHNGTATLLPSDHLTTSSYEVMDYGFIQGPLSDPGSFSPNTTRDFVPDSGVYTAGIYIDGGVLFNEVLTFEHFSCNVYGSISGYEPIGVYFQYSPNVGPANLFQGLQIAFTGAINATTEPTFEGYVMFETNQMLTSYLGEGFSIVSLPYGVENSNVSALYLTFEEGRSLEDGRFMGGNTKNGIGFATTNLELSNVQFVSENNARIALFENNIEYDWTDVTAIGPFQNSAPINLTGSGGVWCFVDLYHENGAGLCEVNSSPSSLSYKSPFYSSFSLVFCFPLFCFFVLFFLLIVVPAPWQNFQEYRFCGVSLDSDGPPVKPPTTLNSIVSEAEYSSASNIDTFLLPPTPFTQDTNWINGSAQSMPQSDFPCLSCGLAICDLLAPPFINCVIPYCIIDLNTLFSGSFDFTNVIFGLNCETLTVSGVLNALSLNSVTFRATEKVILNSVVFSSDDGSRVITVKTRPRRLPSGLEGTSVDLNNIEIKDSGRYVFYIDAQMDEYLELSVYDPGRVYFVSLQNWTVGDVDFVMDVYGKMDLGYDGQDGGVVLLENFNSSGRLDISGRIAGEVWGTNGAINMNGYGINIFNVACDEWRVNFRVDVDVANYIGFDQGVGVEVQEMTCGTVSGEIGVNGELYGTNSARGVSFGVWNGFDSPDTSNLYVWTTGYLTGGTFSSCFGVLFEYPFSMTFNNVRLESWMNMDCSLSYGVALQPYNSLFFRFCSLKKIPCSHFIPFS